MTNLEKLEIACTANDGRFREMTINKAYLYAGLVEYIINWWSKNKMKFGAVKCTDFNSAKKISSKLSKQGHFGKINVFVKDSSDILAYNLWSFGR